MRNYFLIILLCGSLIGGCGGSSSEEGLIPTINSKAPESDFDDLRLYQTSSQYADVLVECASAQTQLESCRLSTLPLIGMETENPAVADIMSRVLVSHTWMGARFEQLLNHLPNDVLLLLRAATAIVIDDDIRPAYYTALTGAIYLDPAYLWLSSSELATINKQEDFRAGFSDPLQFRSLSRYVIDGEYLYPLGLLAENPERSIEDVERFTARLLYHEMAHANDFLPPDSWDSLDTDKSIYGAIVDNESDFVATRLAIQAPLTSSALYSLAGVMYQGEDPSAADLSITATQVGAAFETDRASDNYAYASKFEDTAMLFEETMMKLHYDADRDIAFTEVPLDPATCDGYTVAWGARNRLGDTDVKDRAQFITGEILPSANMAMFFQDFPNPQAMSVGAN